MPAAPVSRPRYVKGSDLTVMPKVVKDSALFLTIIKELPLPVFVRSDYEVGTLMVDVAVGLRSTDDMRSWLGRIPDLDFGRGVRVSRERGLSFSYGNIGHVNGYLRESHNQNVTIPALSTIRALLLGKYFLPFMKEANGSSLWTAGGNSKGPEIFLEDDGEISFARPLVGGEVRMFPFVGVTRIPIKYVPLGLGQ